MRIILDTKLYSVKEVSQMLGLRDGSVRKYIKDGKIRASKIGGVCYMTEESIRDFLQGRRG